MSRVVATGTLVDIDDNFLIDVSSLSTGVLGIMCSGVFGATGVIFPEPSALTGPAGTGQLHFFDPATSSTESWRITAVGLYLFDFLCDVVNLRLSLGSDGVTNIAVVAFAPSRKFYRSGYTGSIA